MLRVSDDNIWPLAQLQSCEAARVLSRSLRQSLRGDRWHIRGSRLDGMIDIPRVCAIDFDKDMGPVRFCRQTKLPEPSDIGRINRKSPERLSLIFVLTGENGNKKTDYFRTCGEISERSFNSCSLASLPILGCRFTFCEKRQVGSW
jgi:hypothetical protein